MANRPNSVEQRLKKLEDGLFKHQDMEKKNSREIKKIKDDINEIKIREVIDMLQQTKQNGRYANSYQDIADVIGFSVGKISNIASEYGLSRLNSIK